MSYMENTAHSEGTSVAIIYDIIMQSLGSAKGTVCIQGASPDGWQAVDEINIGVKYHNQIIVISTADEMEALDLELERRSLNVLLR